MSSKDDFEPESRRRTYQTPHSARHPIPTIQKYRAERHELNDQQEDAEKAQRDETDESTVKRAYHAAKGVITGEAPPPSSHDPYKAQNRNVHVDKANGGRGEQNAEQDGAGAEEDRKQSENKDDTKTDEPGKSATEAVAGHHDPRQKRKAMKHKKRSDGGREVTDPVTHLPIVIRDSTHKDLKSAGENIPAPGLDFRTKTGVDGASKSKEEIDTERKE